MQNASSLRYETTANVNSLLIPFSELRALKLIGQGQEQPMTVHLTCLNTVAASNEGSE